MDLADPAERLDLSLDTLVPDNPNKPYEIKELIYKVVDDGDFFELQPDYAKNIVTGFARMEGRTVGIVASDTVKREDPSPPPSSDTSSDTDEIRRQLSGSFGEDEFFGGGLTIRAGIAEATAAGKPTLLELGRSLAGPITGIRC